MRLGGGRAGPPALDHRRRAAHGHGRVQPGASTLLLTIACFVLIYTVLLVIELKLMVKAIKKAPSKRASRI